MFPVGLTKQKDKGVPEPELSIEDFFALQIRYLRDAVLSSKSLSNQAQAQLLERIESDEVLQGLMDQAFRSGHYERLFEEFGLGEGETAADDELFQLRERLAHLWVEHTATPVQRLMYQQQQSFQSEVLSTQKQQNTLIKSLLGVIQSLQTQVNQGVLHTYQHVTVRDSLLVLQDGNSTIRLELPSPQAAAMAQFFTSGGLGRVTLDLDAGEATVTAEREGERGAPIKGGLLILERPSEVHQTSFFYRIGTVEVELPTRLELDFAQRQVVFTPLGPGSGLSLRFELTLDGEQRLLKFHLQYSNLPHPTSEGLELLRLGAAFAGMHQGHALEVSTAAGGEALLTLPASELNLKELLPLIGNADYALTWLEASQILESGGVIQEPLPFPDVYGPKSTEIYDHLDKVRNAHAHPGLTATATFTVAKSDLDQPLELVEGKTIHPIQLQRGVIVQGRVRYLEIILFPGGSSVREGVRDIPEAEPEMIYTVRHSDCQLKFAPTPEGFPLDHARIFIRPQQTPLEYPELGLETPI